MAKKLSKAAKSAMIVDPKTSGAARAQATSMLSKKRAIGATRFTRGK